MLKGVKMSNTNQKLNKAGQKKDDEYYTQIKDIEDELRHYKEHFKDKIVFCNCDDPKESNFFRYFALNFEHLGLKKLISTHFEKEKPTYKLEISKSMDLNEDGKIDFNDIQQIPLMQNGDFRSPECMKILEESDIVVTNPPFSLFREYIDTLINNNKKFIIIGNSNAISYKNCFEYIKNNEMWLGYNCVRWFIKPSGDIVEAARSFWYTNLDIAKRHENFLLFKKYNSDDFSEYDNYNAIEVGLAKNIPIDYDGVMGVPITFLDKHNPKQFELVGLDYYVKDGRLPELIKEDWQGKLDRGYLKGKRLYSRLLIKHARPLSERQ